MDSTALGGADPSAASPIDQAVDRDQSERPTAAAEDQTDAQPPKKKQKRNKPTLSCDCCVERKTKVGAPDLSSPVNCMLTLTLVQVRQRPPAMSGLCQATDTLSLQRGRQPHREVRRVCLLHVPRLQPVFPLTHHLRRNGGRPSAKVRKKAQVQAQLGVVTPNSSEVMLLFITILSIAPLFEALHHYSRDLLTGPSISRAVRWPSIYSPIRSDPSNPSLWIMSGTATPTRP